MIGLSWKIPSKIWMMTGSSPMTQETFIFGVSHQIPRKSRGKCLALAHAAAPLGGCPERGTRGIPAVAVDYQKNT